MLSASGFGRWLCGGDWAVLVVEGSYWILMDLGNLGEN